MENLETKKARIVKWGSIALVGVAGLVVAPIIYFVIKGLVGLAIAGVIGMGMVFGAPVLATKFANWRLKALKSEAAKNPIETFQLQYKTQTERLAMFASSITDFATGINSFEGQLDEFKATATPAEVVKFDNQLQAMRKLLSLRRAKYDRSKQDLAEFAQEINRAKAYWKMSEASHKLSQAANMDFDPMAQIMKETAMESVMDSMHRSFAELETELMKEDKIAMLEFMPGETIDVASTRVAVGVKR